MNIGDVIFQFVFIYCSRDFPVCRDIRIQKHEAAPPAIGQDRKETRCAARRKKPQIRGPRDLCHTRLTSTSSTLWPSPFLKIKSDLNFVGRIFSYRFGRLTLSQMEAAMASASASDKSLNL